MSAGHSENGPRVLVVGAGLAGVAAAASLRAAGCSVRTIEREPSPGGRASGSERDGFRLDAAPFLVSARERRLHALVVAAGLAEQLLPLRPVALVHVRGGHLDPAPPAGSRLEVARIGGVRLREAWRLHRLARLERRFADLLDPEAPERAVRLDDRSVADFVRLYFGPSVLARWAEPIVGSDQLGDASEWSRASFLLARRARGEAPLATLRGSPAEIARALVRVEQDRLGVEATSLAREGRAFALETSAAAESADAVVLALPADETLRIASACLASAEREGLARLGAVPSLVLHLALDRAPLRKATRIRIPLVESSPLATVAVEPGGPKGPAPGAPQGPAPDGAALVTLVARPDWSRAHLDAADGVIAKELLGALDRVLPRASASARFSVLRRYPHAAPSFEVGAYRGLARLRALQVEQRTAGRRLYFAGDQWSAPTLEGAAASGLRAAGELCADFGLGTAQAR